MSDVTIKRVEEFDTPNGGGFCRARAGSRRRTVVRDAGRELPAALLEEHPEHDHCDDGQEEVYTALSGSATLHVGDSELRCSSRACSRASARASGAR